MKNAKKILGVFVVVICTLFLAQNTVDAVMVESSSDLKTIFEEKGATVNGKTVTLTKNIEDEDIYEISGDDYILDLNGYKFTVGEFYINDGSLTINDSKETGELDTIYDWLGVEEGAKLTINNGKFDFLVNAGTTIINNGTGDMLTNEGTMTIKAGIFGGLWQRGTATINGGTFTASFASNAIDLDNGKTTIAGNVEFKKTGENTALMINSSESIDGKVIKQLLGEGYISATTGYETINDSWYDEELQETVYHYEVDYETTIVIKDETESIFNRIAPNDIWTINGSKPKDFEEADFLLPSIARDINIGDNYILEAYVELPEDFNPEKVDMVIKYKIDEYQNVTIAQKKVKAVYNEPSKEVKTKVNSVLEKIAEKTGDNHDIETGFLLEDLYLINYLNASTTGMDSSLALNFSKDLIKLTNGGNISYKYDSRLGAFTPTGLWRYSGGRVIVYYNGIAVGTTNIGLTTSNVLYVPSDTKDTDEARIAAALKRIEDYLGTTKEISISVGGTLDSLNKDEFTWKDYGFVDAKTSGTNYYNVTINGKTYKFAICKKDVKELETPEYLGSDIVSNISIKSNSTELPLDTAITVKPVTSDEIQKSLGTNVYVAYDISLYSNAKQANIEKLENGKFIVNIPVPEILKDKEITVYYINGKGEKEEHIATVKDAIASFETDHFSTYVLSEKVDEKNPDTFDGIGSSVFMGIISLFGLVCTTLYLKKKNKES